ncbi:MAG: MBL fold metallo-hydrolase, partial [Limimaricola sp.]
MQLIIMTAIAATIAAPALAQSPIWDANTVQLERQMLEEGIYAVIPAGAAEMAPEGAPIATTSGFVIGEEGVLLIDTMLNERLVGQLLDLVAEVTDAPVRYAVNTSYHGDHSYGNAYLPDTAIIIQHEATAAFIGEHFAEDTAFMIQNFGEGRGIEEVTPTDADILVAAQGGLSIDLGGQIVEIRDHGFAQTGGDLFVSVPEANVL